MKRLLAPIILILIITACAPGMTPVPATATALSSVTPVPTLASTAKPSATPAPIASATTLPTFTPTISPEPTYTDIRGVVNQEHVNCYYGPSKAYLYKYGLLKGNRLDIIGIMEDTGYIEVQAIGGDNPCWMNLEFMDVQGDIHVVMPVDPLAIKMPWSPYYPGLNSALAKRSGNEVTIVWEPLKLRKGDDSEQEPYLLETWVCRDGKLTFVPIGTYENKVTVVDESGCSEPSSGRVYGVEKHGYTKYLKFQWPPAKDQ